MTRNTGILATTAGLGAMLALGLAPLRSLGAAELYLFSERKYSSGFRSSSHALEAKIALFRVGGGRLLELPAKVDPADAPELSMPGTTISDAEMRILAIAGVPRMPSPFRLLSMDRPDRFRALEVSAPGWLLGTAHICDTPDRGKILLFRLFNDDSRITHAASRAQKLMALDTATDQWVEASPDTYRFARVLGGATGYESSWMDTLGLLQREAGQLVMPVAEREINMGPLLPTELRFKQGDHPRLFLNNPSMMAAADLMRIDDPARPDPPLPVTYRILEKGGNAWHRLEIPGDISWNVRAFGPWMAGIIDENLRGKRLRNSPGRRYTDEWKLFDDIDLYLVSQYVYRTGRLFLYNVPNRRYYEWDTHNGDCEVILVEAGQVYYRVDQAIYRAPIGEKTLGKPTLIVEGSDVPSIHWAFFGPNAAAQRPIQKK